MSLVQTQALDYARRGWPVLPLFGVREDGSCRCAGKGRCSPGKHPCTSQGLKQATTDPARIEAWTRWEQANLGLRTGALSGFWVLDVDRDHDGERSLTALQNRYGALPPTLEVQTGGGGRHLYFAYPGVRVRNSVGRLGPGLDVRGDEGYVVAPPSRHASGQLYRWKIPLAENAQPAQTPSWLSKLVTAPYKNSRTQTPLNGASSSSCMRRAGPVGSQHRASPSLLSDGWTPELTQLSNVTSAQLEWLWPQRIPLGKLTLLAGDPGLGKSLLTLDFAARVTRGASWPDLEQKTPEGQVLLLAAEDDLADTLRPRLEAAGANLERIHELTALRQGDQRRLPNLAEDLRPLQKALDLIPNVRLLIIDPISAYLGDTDENANAAIRGLLAPLTQLAAAYHLAIVAVTHLRKSAGKAIYRTMGSLAFAATSRSVWCVSEDPQDPHLRLFEPLKTNLGPKPTPLTYAIHEGPVVRWITDRPVRPNLCAESPASHPTQDKALEKASQWLQAILASGPLWVRELERKAQENGFSLATIRRARAQLACRARKNATAGWELSLPSDKSKDTPTPLPEQTARKEQGMLNFEQAQA